MQINYKLSQEIKSIMLYDISEDLGQIVPLISHFLCNSIAYQIYNPLNNGFRYAIEQELSARSKYDIV